MERWTASTIPSASNAASEPRVRPVRPQRSSMPRASKAPKRAAPTSIRMAMTLARRSKAEAARPGRYPGSDAACDRHCSRYPGPRRRGYAAGHAIRPLSLPAQALRRWRLSRTRVPRLRASRPGAGGSGDRQTLGSGQRLRRLAETLGGGKNAGLAGPLPPSRQGLGGAQPQGPRLSDDGLHPPHGQKAMPQLRMIPDRLLVAQPWLRLHTPLIEPDVRIARIRLSDKTSRRLSRATPSAASEPHVELIGCPISLSFATFCICLELRSLPSAGVTRFPRYDEALRQPRAPGLSLTGVRLVLSSLT